MNNVGIAIDKRSKMLPRIIEEVVKIRSIFNMLMICHCQTNPENRVDSSNFFELSDW